MPDFGIFDVLYTSTKAECLSQKVKSVPSKRKLPTSCTTPFATRIVQVNQVLSPYVAPFVMNQV